jgi:hypothetical protein
MEMFPSGTHVPATHQSLSHLLVSCDDKDKQDSTLVWCKHKQTSVL